LHSSKLSIWRFNAGGRVLFGYQRDCDYNEESAYGGEDGNGFFQHEDGQGNCDYYFGQKQNCGCGSGQMLESFKPKIVWYNPAYDGRVKNC
jgi:hypothetical protein